MYTEDVILNYKGFTPNQRTVNQLKSITDILLGEAPSESCIKATFTRSGKNMYLGIVKINSSVGSFFAMAKEHDITTLSQKLIERVREQLNKWKDERFQTPEINPEELTYGQRH